MPPFGYRWEYSPLARIGDWLWQRAIDPFLCWMARDRYILLRRGRGLIQLIILCAIVMIPVSFFYSPSHMLTASGLLFDIAGVLRLFVLEEIEHALGYYAENRKGNIPSPAMRELIMPEALPDGMQSESTSAFFYKKRGVLFLFVGFVLQMIGDLVG
jgi:hypothetical protein